MPHIVIDAANVVGSRPDGWWRDRAGASRRLAARIVAALDENALEDLGSGILGGDSIVHLVLEGAAARASGVTEHPRLRIVRAPADGDAVIAALARGLGGDSVVVVTADRGLRERVQAAGATTVGPGVLWRALPEAQTS